MPNQVQYVKTDNPLISRFQNTNKPEKFLTIDWMAGKYGKYFFEGKTYSITSKMTLKTIYNLIEK